MARETVCRGCGAPIVFVKSKLGKYIPCDTQLVRYRENPEGKDVVVVEGDGAVRCDLDFEGLPTGMATQTQRGRLWEFGVELFGKSERLTSEFLLYNMRGRVALRGLVCPINSSTKTNRRRHT